MHFINHVHNIKYILWTFDIIHFIFISQPSFGQTNSFENLVNNLFQPCFSCPIQKNMYVTPILENTKAQPLDSIISTAHYTVATAKKALEICSKRIHMHWPPLIKSSICTPYIIALMDQIPTCANPKSINCYSLLNLLNLVSFHVSEATN